MIVYPIFACKVFQPHLREVYILNPQGEEKQMILFEWLKK
jgi:hypothetical protein